MGEVRVADALRERGRWRRQREKEVAGEVVGHWESKARVHK
jgi:hypothetical protein